MESSNEGKIILLIKREKENEPGGRMERHIGRVRIALIPYLSDRFPMTGIITIVPIPIALIIQHKNSNNIVINKLFLKKLIKIKSFENNKRK